MSAAEQELPPTLRYERRGPVTWVTIDRPEARNALDRSVREGLFAAVRRFDADPDAAVLVLTGAGEVAFSAGGDLKEMAADALAVPPPDFLPQLQRNLSTAKPVIAATEVTVGRGAPWAAPLPSLLPPKVALQLLLTGDPISAERAFQLGLVNLVVPGDRLQAEVQALGERIARNAPLSVRAAKEMVYATRGLPLHEAYAEAERLFAPVYASADAQEGPRAFRDKRRPRWTGR
jgi:enoyl-CoA hydratase/carnithine racemase